jgi:hypothetical protein
MVTLDLWHIGLIIATLIGALWAMGRVFIGMYIKSNDKRFALYEDELKEQHAAHDKTEENVRKVERDFLLFRAELPERYVLKADLDRFREFIEMRVQEIRSLIIGLEAAIKAKADKE